MYDKHSSVISTVSIRIMAALGGVKKDMLHGVREEIDYRLDVCRVTRGAHIEGL
jgi:hypothetical protein